MLNKYVTTTRMLYHIQILAELEGRCKTASLYRRAALTLIKYRVHMAWFGRYFPLAD